ncbi:MAG: hypothetical protein N5P05_001899 [Chroococcopsis gigantea SAG 12.99]|jgi:tetratricopeptide (TPR) repeat protein|nr:tetratricopeptide repeat protein [Chlorogloea purpurea SAG 13.99]MDV3000293.1 hypothetical protein [Chroococcopsis gigantea SAG 12.99]
MQGLLGQIWQAIKKFFNRLLGVKPGSSNQREFAGTLTDTEYEFLFMQLLEGVAHGWHEGRIAKFFERLGPRGNQRQWVEWLTGFGERLQASAAINQQLGVRIMRLGELTQSFPGLELLGATAYGIGRQMLTRDADTLIWEYDGFDNSGTEIPQSDLSYSYQATPESDNTETLTVEELYGRLQDNPELAATMAAQYGLQSSDPEDIIAALLQEYGLAQTAVNEEPAQTSEELFEKGLKQADLADWQGAIDSWEQALKIDPEEAAIWHNRGTALSMLGRFEEALDNYSKALELEPDDYQILNAKGSALYGLQRWSEALSCWDKVIELQPDFYQAWYNRGSTLEQLGQQEQAIGCYKKTLELEPGFNLAKYRLNSLLGEAELN